VSGASGYDVQQQRNEGSWVTVTFNTTSRDITYSGLTPGSLYRYRVRSRQNTTSGTIFSVYTESIVSLLLPPGVPAAIRLARQTDLASILVSWDAVASYVGAGFSAATYTLEQITTGTSWTTVATITGTSRTVSGLIRGNTYNFRVRANNAAGSSGYRTSDAITLVPFRPASVSASLSGDTSIRVTWPAANGATSYNVDRSENGGGYVRVSSGTTSRDITYGSLNRGSSYVFRVFSLNDGGSSPTARDSNSVQIPFPPPSAPSSASISKNKRDVTISLGTASTPSGTTISSYEIEIRASGGSYGSRRSVSPSSRATTYTGLTPGVTYQGRGRAINEGGAGDWRETGTVTISSPPSIPASISATRSFRNVFVDLGISTAANDVTISGYEIQRRESTNAGATWGAWGSSVITSTTDRTTTYTNLNALSTYQFRGRALSDFNPGEFRTSDAIFIPGFPDPPQQVLALQEGASVRVILTTPISDGGTPILTYRIEKRVSQDFGVTWSNWEDPVVIPGNEPVYLYESLTLQRTYQFRALSTNSEGDSESFTESNSVYLPAIVKIRDEGVFRLPSDYKRYDEDIGAWIGLSTYKRYFNGEWFDLE
jgi:hypothetical protein